MVRLCVGHAGAISRSVLLSVFLLCATSRYQPLRVSSDNMGVGSKTLGASMHHCYHDRGGHVTVRTQSMVRQSKSWTYGEESSSSSRDMGPDNSHSEPLIVHCAAELDVLICSVVRSTTGSAPGRFVSSPVSSWIRFFPAPSKFHKPRFIVILRSRLRQIHVQRLLYGSVMLGSLIHLRLFFRCKEFVWHSRGSDTLLLATSFVKIQFLFLWFRYST